MTDQAQSLDVAINNFLTMVQNQLSNTKALVETQSGLVAEALNFEIEQYNAICDQVEQLQEKNDNLELKVINLTKTNEDLELEHVEALTKLRKEFNLLKTRTADVPAMRTELKRLKEMNPDSLKERLAKSRKTADERLEKVNRLKSENNRYRKENIRLERDVTELTETALQATKLAEEMQAKVVFLDGDVENQKAYVGKDGLEFFIYKYGYPLSFKPMVENLRVIRDLHFHIELRSNWAICCIVSVSDWLIPLIPTVQEFEGRYPEDLYIDLQEIYTNSAAAEHQYLIDRVDHFKEVELASIYDGIITDRELNMLNDANYYSVYSVMHPTDQQLAKAVKGISEKTAKRIRDEIDRKIVQPWERNNWTKEQIKEIRR